MTSTAMVIEAGLNTAKEHPRLDPQAGEGKTDRGYSTQAGEDHSGGPPLPRAGEDWGEGLWRRLPSIKIRSLIPLLLLTTACAAVANPLVIAHRGASGYLPEHTMESKVMAYMMGADYLEQDVVLTRDDVPIVLHDLHLDAVSDVALRYPDRARADGMHYAIDLTLEEIRTLKVHERVRLPERVAQFPQRFPAENALFRIHTLEEEIALIRSLDLAFNRHTGIHVELKDPAWHQAANKDIATIVLDILIENGYQSSADRVFIQSFDPDALERLSTQAHQIPLIQLIGDNRWWPESGIDHDAMRTRAGLDRIARYADGIGAWLGHLHEGLTEDGTIRPAPLVAEAKQRNLDVHVYTLRRDALPEGIKDLDELHEFVFNLLGVDGAFTDFPDLTREFLQR